MVSSSKITSDERLIRKRANARLRQQRCRARKRNKLALEKSLKSMKKQVRVPATAESENWRKNLNTKNCVPPTQSREDVPARSYPPCFPGCHTAAVNVCHSKHGAFVPVLPSAPKGTGHTGNLSAMKNKPVESELRQDAIEAMLSLRFDPSKSQDSATKRVRSVSPYGVTELVNDTHSLMNKQRSQAMNFSSFPVHQAPQMLFAHNHMVPIPDGSFTADHRNNYSVNMNVVRPGKQYPFAHPHDVHATKRLYGIIPLNPYY